MYNKFDQLRFQNPSSSHYFYTSPAGAAEPGYFFFPPVPPPLDSELRVLPPFAHGIGAPPELAPFVGEIFYPMLAARMADGDLSKGTRARLQAYRTAKVALQAELRLQIAGLKDADPAARDGQLAAFAVSQSPRIFALEATAEKLRSDLQRINLLGESADAPTRASEPPARIQPAGPSTGEDSHREARAVRGAAFYQEGFSPAQRRLLLEAATDLDAQASPGSAAVPAAPEGWLLSFSPEPSRIRILANLPAPQAQKISEYVAGKTELKAQLLSALRRTADASGAARIETMKQLAAAQAPRLADLEAAAEAIRRDLAALPNPPGPPAPPSLPPELMERISSYRTHKVELLRTLYGMLAGPADDAHAARVPANAPSGEPADGTPGWLHDGATATAVRPAGLKVSVEEFNRRQVALVGELNRELAGIREALADYVRTTNQPTDRKSINDLLTDFERARQKQEIWDQYRDYQAAVLLPGLSPEQRRLLFDAAVEQLGLPLPPAEQLD
jgi:hypothetical protein